MALALAVSAGLGAAVAYGIATAVQHDAAYTGTGTASATGLVRLVRDRRWLLSIAGDVVGLVLQIIAQATGPIVVIQPLLVLAVVVAMPVAWRLGGPRPTRSDLWACLAVIVALSVFFVVVGDPGEGSAISEGATAWLVVISVVAAGVALVSLYHRTPWVKAAVVGAIAGGLFGVVGVLLDQVAWDWSHHGGLPGVVADSGWVASIGLVAVAALAMLLTQISFQVGALNAGFPANQAAAPVVAVLLGALLLHERLPSGPGFAVLYGACLAAVVLGTVRLADARRHVAVPASVPRLAEASRV
jgi:hypothetical protein